MSQATQKNSSQVLLKNLNKKRKKMRYVAVINGQRYVIVPQATVEEDGTYTKYYVEFDPNAATVSSEEETTE